MIIICHIIIFKRVINEGRYRLFFFKSHSSKKKLTCHYLTHAIFLVVLAKVSSQLVQIILKVVHVHTHVCDILSYRQQYQ